MQCCRSYRIFGIGMLSIIFGFSYLNSFYSTFSYSYYYLSYCICTPFAISFEYSTAQVSNTLSNCMPIFSILSFISSPSTPFLKRENTSRQFIANSQHINSTPYKFLPLFINTYAMAVLLLLCSHTRQAYSKGQFSLSMFYSRVEGKCWVRIDRCRVSRDYRDFWRCCRFIVVVGSGGNCCKCCQHYMMPYMNLSQAYGYLLNFYVTQPIPYKSNTPLPISLQQACIKIFKVSFSETTNILSRFYVTIEYIFCYHFYESIYREQHTLQFGAQVIEY